MAKPEWGIKRTCGGCSAPFYDMTRDPIVCPKCGVTFDPEQMVRLKRSRNSAADNKAKAAAAKPVAVVPVAVAEEEAEEEAEDVAEDVVAGAGTEEIDADDDDDEDAVLVSDDDLDDDDDLDEIVPKEKTVE